MCGLDSSTAAVKVGVENEVKRADEVSGLLGTEEQHLPYDLDMHLA